MRVPLSHSTKFLGVTLDENLTWTLHIQNISNKVSKAIGIIHRLKNIVPFKTLLILYNILILPFLSYCCIVWGYTYSVHINKLYILQKKVLRAIYRTPYDSHSNPLFRDSNVFTIFELVKYYTLIFVFNYFNDNLPRNFSNFFLLNSSLHDYNTRNANLLSIPRFSLTSSQHYVKYSAITNWNSLPTSFKSIKTVSQFKRKIKHYLLCNRFL